MTDTYEREYYTEAYRIILTYGKEYIEKIPHKLLENIKSNIDENYDFEFDPTKSFKEQNVKKEAVSLIVALKLQYWCKNEEEKNSIKEKLKQNSIKHEEEKREKYSYENLFKNAKSNETEEENAIEECTDLQKYEKSGIMKIVDRIKEFIKNIFKRS